MATQTDNTFTTTGLETRLEILLQAMTLEEQVSLLAGASFWLTVPVERLGIPAIKVSDGPNGARGGGALVGGVPAACFPVGISLASTWNTGLVEQIGQALGEEAQSKGARVLLGPTVNIHRSTLNGRNFECYSEDPCLSAQIVVAYIKGVQSRGVAATVKHYVGNESEFQRMTISSEIDDRPLHEIYLLPFEAAVKEARVWAVMSGYNKVNGTYAGDHPQLLRGILKDEWGFDGVVMSDWFANHSPTSVEAGLDLEMPGPARERGAKLVQAVRSGQVCPEAVQESARRVLRLIARVGAFDDPTIPDEQALDRPEHRALIRRAGAEGIVLLKNNGVLPLDKHALTTLAVIGPNAKTAQIMGGGSAQVNAHYRISPLEGITAQVGRNVEIGYEPGCTNYKYLPLLPGRQLASLEGEPGLSVEYFNNLDLSGPVVFRKQTLETELMWLDTVGPGVERANFSARLTTRFTPETSGEYHFSLVSAGLSRMFVNGHLVVDNWDAWQPGDSYFTFGSQEAIGVMKLQAGQPYDLTIEYSRQNAPTLAAVRVGMFQPLGDEAIERAVALAAAADVAVICAGLTGEWDSEGQDRPHMDLVGRQNELIARVAAANPRTVVVLQTGGPVTMPWLNQVAGVMQAWYPGQECGNAIADVLFGEVNPSGKLPQTFPVRLEDNPAFINYPGENDRVRYGEGIFVGYRYYEKKRVEPLFPFGFGLSYTSFSYANLRLSTEAITPDGQLTVNVDVTNTGQRPGQEVVQLYVHDVTARLTRPPKELKSFAKVALAPAETKTVTLTLDRQALAYWDDAQQAWVAEAGEFEVLLGSSAQDIQAQARFRLTDTVIFGGRLKRKPHDG
ncbi:MAG: glycoside hydrolase family 3 C-terminal domain-containing protein [Anaerolineae bacterium]|nr:glycoside hydrolase family 3 C-terminal domain-containing protein [Anaerolineae bacterium]